MGLLPTLEPIAIALIAVAASLMALILILVLLIRQNRLLRRYRMLLAGNSTEDLESMLLRHAEQLQTNADHLHQVDRRLEQLATGALTHVQKTGIVRFNAFPDTGSDLSFAIALLDAHDNGIVLSSLYGRTESRIYAKPIKAGTSTYTLTDEERQALASASGKDEATK